MGGKSVSMAIMVGSMTLCFAELPNAQVVLDVPGQPFVARPPFEILVNGATRSINLGGVPRIHDLVGGSQIVDAVTGVSNFATLNAWDRSNARTIFSGPSMPHAGVPGRIEKRDGQLVLAAVAGDSAVAGRCRAQASSFPVPSRRRFVWDLQVQFGKNVPGYEWTLTAPGKSPVLIWQLKAPDLQPSLGLVVDTDSKDPSKLMLFFARRGGHNVRVTRVGEIHGIERHQLSRITMEAELDERDVGGAGWWRAWVNGQLVVDVPGATLSAVATEPHQWFIGVYMYNDPCPTDLTRATYWTMAKMLVSAQ